MALNTPKSMNDKKNMATWEWFMISAYGPAPLKREEKSKSGHAICKLLQMICATDSHKFLRFGIGYLMCVKQKTDFGDPLEDKINTKIRWANICNTPIT